MVYITVAGAEFGSILCTKRDDKNKLNQTKVGPYSLSRILAAVCTILRAALYHLICYKNGAPFVLSSHVLCPIPKHCSLREFSTVNFVFTSVLYEIFKKIKK